MTNYAITEYVTKDLFVAATIDTGTTFEVLPYWDGKKSRFITVTPAPNKSS